MIFKTVKGMKDYYPEDYSKIKFILDKWYSCCKKYSAEYYDAPVLEDANIWLSKKGSLPDEMYIFKDKANNLLALRPELTPSLARMLSKKIKELKKPIKYFSAPKCYRYEQPQRGRDREFYQLNYDVISFKSDYFIAESIALLCDFFDSLGIKRDAYEIRLSSRTFLEDYFKEFKNKEEIFSLVDSYYKISEKELKEKADAIDNRLFEKIMLLKNSSPSEDLKDVMALLDAFSVSVVFDPYIVRGLDYYKGIVFEVFFKDSSLNRAVAGGGYYDSLFELFSKEKVPAFGFGIGVSILMLYLSENNLFPKYERDIKYYVIVLYDIYMSYAIKVIRKLLKDGNVFVSDTNSLSKALNQANSLSAEYAVIIGKKEFEKSVYLLRNLKTGLQEEISF